MKKKIIILILLIGGLSLTSCSLFTNQQEPVVINEIIHQHIEYSQDIKVEDLEEALTIGSEIAKASSVGIYVETSGIFSKTSIGSGVIIDNVIENGKDIYYVITNRHVVEFDGRTANSISIYMGQYGLMINATRISCPYDSGNVDIALLKFENKTGRKFSTVTIGDSENLKAGQFAIAVGNPHDLYKYYHNVTVGHINHHLRTHVESLRPGVENFYIQHDAAINPGNSGGGLFNLKGELIGINTWKIVDSEYDGMGFAVPVHIAMETIKDAIKK